MFKYRVTSSDGLNGKANTVFEMKGSAKAHLEIIAEARRRYGENTFVSHYHRL